jgi:hypothetical protein
MIKENTISKFIGLLLILVISFGFVLPVNAAGIGFTRVKIIGDTGATPAYQWQELLATTTDSSGNVYHAGCYTGTVDFDPSSGTDIHTYTRGVLVNGWDSYCDSYVTKLDSSGNYVWTKTWGGETSDYVRGVAVDSSGNVYTHILFQDTVDFDPGAGTFNLTGHNDDSSDQPWDWDAAVSKLDSDGNFVWAKSWGCENSNVSSSIALDSSGNVYTSGHQACTTDFDPGAGTFNLTAHASSFYGSAAYISKLDSDGNFVWAKNFINAASDYVSQLSIDSSDNLYLSGGFTGTVDFDPGAGTSNMTVVGTKNAYIVKLTSAGALVWVKNISEGTVNGRSIHSNIDSSGNVYIGGSFNGTGDFDPGAGTSNMTTAGLTDAFVVKLDSSGTFVWAKQVGGTSDDSVNSVDNDSLGNVYIVGKFKETADFDPGAGTSNLTSNGDVDLFILKLDSSGVFQYVKQIGGSDTEYTTYGLNVLAEDSLYVGGAFKTTVDFDPTAGIDSHTSAGNADIFLLRLDYDSTAPTPTLSSPSNLANTTATITWTTNENSSSIVEYGLTTSYGSTTTEADTGAGVTSHSVNLTGLDGCTTYHFRVKSNDVVSNLGTSSDSTFSTSGCAAVPIFILQAMSDAIRAQQNNNTVTPVTTNNTQNTQTNTNINSNLTPIKFIFTRNLKLGMRDTQVIELQKFLNSHNFLISTTGPGSLNNETNYFGLATKASLIKFQKANGIKPASGYFGAVTRSLVNELVR